MSGITIAADSPPALTLDICHPLQTLTVSALPLFLPSPHDFVSETHLIVHALSEVDPHSFLSRLADAPDSPPPKLSA